MSGIVRPPKESERYFALLRVERVNGDDPDPPRAKILFDNLTPIYPTEPLRLSRDGGTDFARVVDLLCPVGKGQRCMIAAPPQVDRSTLLLDIIGAVETNYPDSPVLVLLIDERPEEVTEIRSAVGAEVISSTFDEPPSRHVQVAEIVIEKAKRMAESGRDAVIVVDTITRLARAYDAVLPPSGKLLSGAIDVAAIHKPKRFFGAARNLEDAGSLTIIATALTETGSRTDEIILEELTGTGNCEIWLDATLPEPHIDLSRSATVNADRIRSAEQQSEARALRDELRALDPTAALARALDRLGS